MSELPPPWGEYARLQTELDDSSHVNGYIWGLEAGLNRLLANPLELRTVEDVHRVVDSEARKERYRATLRRAWLPPEVSTRSAEAALDARRGLRLLKEQVTPKDWALLQAVGDGNRYEEIAASTKVPAGALRVRVLRLRRALRTTFG